MNRQMTARQSNWKRRLIMGLIPWFLTLAQAAAASTTLVDLTEGEKRWLEAHPSIRLALDIDWAPFENIDDEQAYVGMAAAYIKLVSERLGIAFDVEKKKPWAEVVEMVKRGALDGYSCVVSTAQRRQYVSFTRPYLSFPMVIVTSDQVAYVNGIKDLRNEKVAVVKGYATHDLMAKNHPEIDLYLADNVADALEKLRKSVEDAQIDHEYNRVSPYVTISVGIKTYHHEAGQSPDMDLIYRLADDALYSAKENGRNRVVEYGQVSDIPSYKTS